LTRFSIVVPTYERRELVTRSVGALDRQVLRDFEVLVVVDGSRDGSAAALEALSVGFPLTVVEQPNEGRAAAVNAGAARAAGELLLFLDDDMRADPQMLAVHDRAHRDGADVVMGHLPLDPDSPPNLLSFGVGLWTEERRRRLTAPGAEIGLADMLTGQLSVSRADFEELGGFDVGFTREGLFGGEDLDLGYRLIKAGCKLVFEPEAISYQHYEVDPREYLKRSRETGRSDRELVAKHPELAGEVAAGPSFKTRRSRWLLAPFVRAPAAFGAPLRLGAVAIVASGWTGFRARRLFFAVRTLEYLRGRRAAGAPRRRTAGVTVLAYHAVSDLSADPILAQYGVEPETLAAQLDHLRRRGHSFIDLDGLLAGMDGAPLPDRPALVTFDDAYDDLVPGAARVLSERGIPAVVFVVSGLVGASNEWDQRIGASRMRLLDTAGLRKLVEAGFEIGSHSITHPQLTKVDAAEASVEVGESAVQIESLGLPRPRAFAYPHGEWSEAIAATAAAAGYAAAFTIDPGRVGAGSPRFALPRIEVLASDTMFALRVKLATADWPARRRRRLLRLLGVRQ
jgi:GT2 family glycosyltransferase/peptidoglycan/xylan/chitin deacetylase (PgdA/CDA1 family)